MSPVPDAFVPKYNLLSEPQPGFPRRRDLVVYRRRDGVQTDEAELVGVLIFSEEEVGGWLRFFEDDFLGALGVSYDRSTNWAHSDVQSTDAKNNH